MMLNPYIFRFACGVATCCLTLIFACSTLAQSASERARRLEPHLLEAGIRHGVDPSLLWTVCWLESRFYNHARSPKGAVGVMQLMPATAARFGVRERLDALQNINGGAAYLRFLIDFFGGDVALVLAGYNAGEGAVLKYGRRVPPYRETQNYVRDGLLLLERVQVSALYRDAAVPRVRLTTASYAPVRESASSRSKRSALHARTLNSTAAQVNPIGEEESRDAYMIELVALDALDVVETNSVDESLEDKQP